MSSSPPPDKLLSGLAAAKGGVRCRYCISPAMLASALSYFFLFFIDGGGIYSSVFLYYCLLRTPRESTDRKLPVKMTGQDCFPGIPANYHYTECCDPIRSAVTLSCF